MDQILLFLQKAATKALIDEVCTTPKPGLVDRHDNGAHQDMDIQTFLASTKAIIPWLTKMAETGLSWSGSAEGLFAAIRPLGMKAEKAMLCATKGVNTHKGAIFSMGILEAAAAWYYKTHGDFSIEPILMLCRQMTLRPLEQDFITIDAKNLKTAGECLYLTHGYKGIRGEAQSGFASVRRYSLPLLRQFSGSATDQDKLYLQILLQLMCHVDDTNVMTRAGVEAAAWVKQEARRILSPGECLTSERMVELARLNEVFIHKNISPGGCADLLAVTIFLGLLEHSLS